MPFLGQVENSQRRQHLIYSKSYDKMRPRDCRSVFRNDRFKRLNESHESIAGRRDASYNFGGALIVTPSRNFRIFVDSRLSQRRVPLYHFIVNSRYSQNQYFRNVLRTVVRSNLQDVYLVMKSVMSGNYSTAASTLLRGIKLYDLAVQRISTYKTSCNGKFVIKQ